MSVEEELDATEIELKQQKYAIELLKKQNDFLRKQNEEFISKYGSYFPTSPINQSSPERVTTETSVNSIPSHHSLSGTPEILTPTIQTQLIPDILNIDTSSAPISPLSPLTTLTDKQTSIILSYSNNDVSFPDTTIIPNNNTKHDASNENIVDLGSRDINLCVHTVSECKSIQRIISALKWYSLCGNDYDELLKKITDNKYDKCLVDDYQHILNHHLCQQYQINMNKEYEIIKNEINQQIEACDIETCNGYKRYKEISKKNVSQSGDKEFCLDFMDLIHCYFIHLHDLQ